MKKKLLIRLFLLLTMFPAFTTGALAQTDDIDYTTGVFFVNEDWYGHQNSTVNYLTEKGEWVYRVIQKENPGMELGCTNQHGIIYGDRFYLIAKQQQDPGSKIKGGRITVADAKTMKVIKQLDKIDPSGNTCDGRGCLGVDENKVYISTSNGIWIFNSNTLEVTGQIKGTENPFAASGTGGNANPGNKALYWGQSGCMVRINDYVFSVHQEYGVLVIDPSTDKVIKVIDMKSLIDTFNEYLAEKAKLKDDAEPCVGSSLVMAKDGSLWVSVTLNKDGYGNMLPFIVRIDPISFGTEVVYISPDTGNYPPASSWYAWTPDGFCASNVENALYWNGGENSWFSNSKFFKFDVDTRTVTNIIDLDKQPEKWKLYGCSMRPHPITGDLYMSLFKGDFADNTYKTVRTDKDGKMLKGYPMIKNYWFPSLPVFPDVEAPIPNDLGIKNIDTNEASTKISLSTLAHDADNMDAAMVKTVEKVSDNSKFNAEIKNGELIVTPKTKFTSEEFVKIKINSNGKIAYATIKLNCTTNGIESVQNNDVKEIKRYNLSGQETNKRNGRIQIIRMSDGTVKKVFVK